MTGHLVFLQAQQARGRTIRWLDGPPVCSTVWCELIVLVTSCDVRIDSHPCSYGTFQTASAPSCATHNARLCPATLFEIDGKSRRAAGAHVDARFRRGAGSTSPFSAAAGSVPPSSDASSGSSLRFLPLRPPRPPLLASGSSARAVVTMLYAVFRIRTLQTPEATAKLLPNMLPHASAKLSVTHVQKNIIHSWVAHRRLPPSMRS